MSGRLPATGQPGVSALYGLLCRPGAGPCYPTLFPGWDWHSEQGQLFALAPCVCAMGEGDCTCWGHSMEQLEVLWRGDETNCALAAGWAGGALWFQEPQMSLKALFPLARGHS